MDQETPPLRLYDTMAREKRAFVPIDPANVRIYACGPTVYDLAHIGNARPLIVFDVLFRLLRHRYGAECVTYARNVTDVDDKINARAQERGIPIRELTDGTLKQFHADAKALGCLPPTVEPRATDHIAEMRDLIDRLIARGHAYVAADHVLFDVPSMKDYGRLSRRPLDEMVAGARVEVAPYKRSPLDFVLWKPSRTGDPGWPSPGGIAVPGRPGWHIECSAMSLKTLLEPYGGGFTCDDPARNTFDIHAGGLDLIFPHHENEIAQSCCALGTERMANYWLHNGFLQVEGAKMAKSAGNFVTIRQMLTDWHGRPWAGAVVRWAMLMTHYRQPIDWTPERLEEARGYVVRTATALHGDPVTDHIRRIGQDDFDFDNLDRNLWDADLKVPESFAGFLRDDLNTPPALAEVARLSAKRPITPDDQIAIAHCVRMLGLFDRFQCSCLDDLATQGGASLLASDRGEADRLYRNWRLFKANGDERAANEYETVLRTRYGATEVAPDRTEYIDDFRTRDRVAGLIEARTAARARRDFAESDRLRDELGTLGIKLTDREDGTTTWELAR